jgi:hypothetical protein
MSFTVASIEFQQAMTAEVVLPSGVPALAYYAGQDGTSHYFVTSQVLLGSGDLTAGTSVQIRIIKLSHRLDADVLNLATKDFCVLRIPLAQLPDAPPTPVAAPPPAATKELHSISSGLKRVTGRTVNERGNRDARFTTSFSSLSETLPAGAPLFDTDGRWVGLHLIATSAQGFAVSAETILTQFRTWQLNLIDRNQVYACAIGDLNSPEMEKRVAAARNMGQLGAESSAYRPAIMYALEEFLALRYATTSPIDGPPPLPAPSKIQADAQAALSAITSVDQTLQENRAVSSARQNRKIQVCYITRWSGGSRPAVSRGAVARRLAG